MADHPPHVSDYFGQPVAPNTATLAVFGNPSSPVALPHPLEFVVKTFENDPELFAKLPIFNPVLCSISQFITSYVHGSLLPGGVPSNAAYTWDWQTHCAVPDEAIKRAHNESAATARVRFVKKVMLVLRVLPAKSASQGRSSWTLIVTAPKAKSPTVRSCPSLMRLLGPEITVRSHSRRCVGTDPFCGVTSDLPPRKVTHTGRWLPGNAVCDIGLAV